jgi:hypothetical protein
MVVPYPVNEATIKKSNQYLLPGDRYSGSGAPVLPLHEHHLEVSSCVLRATTEDDASQPWDSGFIT